MLRREPISRNALSAFIAEHHRHLQMPVGYKFAVALYAGPDLVAVGIAGRPVARALAADRRALEITRLCSAGHHNACSHLYGALCRAAKALGYDKVVTYALQTEPGTSLLAAGFALDGPVPGREWSCASRRRAPSHCPLPKNRWLKRL